MEKDLTCVTLSALSLSLSQNVCAALISKIISHHLDGEEELQNTWQVLSSPLSVLPILLSFSFTTCNVLSRSAVLQQQTLPLVTKCPCNKCRCHLQHWCQYDGNGWWRGLAEVLSCPRNCRSPFHDMQCLDTISCSPASGHPYIRHDTFVNFPWRCHFLFGHICRPRGHPRVIHCTWSTGWSSWQVQHSCKSMISCCQPLPTGHCTVNAGMVGIQP